MSQSTAYKFILLPRDGKRFRDVEFEAATDAAAIALGTAIGLEYAYCRGFEIWAESRIIYRLERGPLFQRS